MINVRDAQPPEFSFQMDRPNDFVRKSGLLEGFNSSYQYDFGSGKTPATHAISSFNWHCVPRKVYLKSMELVVSETTTINLIDVTRCDSCVRL